MNPVTKALVTNKLGSIGGSVKKQFSFDDKDDDSGAAISDKEAAEMREKEMQEREKRHAANAKRNAEREKKRQEIRDKYGINKDGKGQSKGVAKPEANQEGQDKAKKSEDKCIVM